MRFSIVTVCLNAEETILDTILSVQSQIGVTWEHIIVDGGSADGTIGLIERIKDERLRVISGPDHGLYDAMNKGISESCGDLVAFLNADDYYCNKGVLRLISEEFNGNDIDAVGGAVAVISDGAGDKVVRYYDAIGFRPWMARVGHMPPHPGFFVKREIFDIIGRFNLSFRTAADFDWMLRFFVVHRRKALMLDRLVTNMRFGGRSQSIKGVNLARRESIEALRNHGFSFPVISVWLKYFLKIGSFLNRSAASRNGWA